MSYVGISYTKNILAMQIEKKSGHDDFKVVLYPIKNLALQRFFASLSDQEILNFQGQNIFFLKRVASPHPEYQMTLV